ncbi:MAG: ArsR family transcriptional regulator [Candidatus Bathyarchaeota archaeon B26-2]|nr:MAG: ArsR family transcriptional regulator [Candidatus Bathyarchaeota archaeon B26-2]
MGEELNRFRAKVFKALADPVRLEILHILRGGERCVCEIVPQLRIPQPLVSRHLKILKDCGLVKDRRDGNRRIYSVTDRRVFNIIDEVTPEFKRSLSKIIIEQII